MKKVFLILMSAFMIFAAVPAAACDGDPGCTCSPVQSVFKRGYVHSYISDRGCVYYSLVSDTGSFIYNTSCYEIEGRIYLDDTNYINVRVYSEVTGEKTLSCGSEECTHPTVTTSVTAVSYTYNDTSEQVVFERVMVQQGVYQITKATVGGLVILEHDVVYPETDSPITGAYATSQSPLCFSPYYEAETTEARLEYRLNSTDDYQTAVTVTNPQFYGERSFVFGRTPLKNITLPEDSSGAYVTVRAYFTNGLNEYYTEPVSFYFIQRKGLK